MHLPIRLAIDALLAGGVIAYPTEGVYGLGCLPEDPGALLRLLRLKARDPGKGLILLAATPEDLEDWVDPEDLRRIPPPVPEAPVTWLVRPGPRVSPLVTGAHASLAVRLAGNPTALELCRLIGGPVTSTSANLSGRPVAANRFLLRRHFGKLVDCIVPGDCGPARGPSEIRGLDSGIALRPGKQ
jgi:L-threonylcarbamoyladenylate synthase